MAPTRSLKNSESSSESRLEFIQPMKGQLLQEYFRNNKSMGIKNIQCFPQCVSQDKTDGIHKVGRSCVGSVIIKYTQVSDNAKASAIKAFAKFTMVDEQETSRKKSTTDSASCEFLFKEGAQVNKSIIDSNELGRKNKLGIVFNSKLLKIVTRSLKNSHDFEHEYTFEFKPRTWHYGWRGGRYRKSNHVLEVGICTLDLNNKYTCVASMSSSFFRVLSNRTLKNRKKKLDEEENKAENELNIENNLYASKRIRLKAPKQHIKSGTIAPIEATPDSRLPSALPDGKNHGKRLFTSKFGELMTKADSRFSFNQKPMFYSPTASQGPLSPGLLQIHDPFVGGYDFFDTNSLSQPVEKEKDLRQFKRNLELAFPPDFDENLLRKDDLQAILEFSGLNESKNDYHSSHREVSEMSPGMFSSSFAH